MKMTVLPKTRAGKWSVGFFILFILISVAAGKVSLIQGNTLEYPNPFNSPLLGTLIYLRFLVAIIASFTGLTAIKKYNERAISVYLSIPLGIIFFVGILILLIGSIIGPPN